MGLGPEYQRHCAIQGANTLQEYLKAAQEFEKVTQISDCNVDSKTATSGEVQNSDLKRKIDALQEIVEKFRDQRDQENSHTNHDERQSDRGNKNHYKVNRTTQRSTSYKRQRNQVRNSNYNYTKNNDNFR